MPAAATLLRAARRRRCSAQARRRARSCWSASSPATGRSATGAPFVGPAGEVLDRALAAAGIDRADGLRHQRRQALQVGAARQAAHPPDARELRRCAPAGRGSRPRSSAVKPAVIVCLGTTAAQSLLGPQFPHPARSRPRPRAAHGRAAVLATYHPSAVLRADDPAHSDELYRALIQDLRLARSTTLVKADDSTIRVPGSASARPAGRRRDSPRSGVRKRGAARAPRAGAIPIWWTTCGRRPSRRRRESGSADSRRERSAQRVRLGRLKRRGYLHRHDQALLVEAQFVDADDAVVARRSRPAAGGGRRCTTCPSPATCSTEWWPAPVATAGSCWRILPTRSNGPKRRRADGVGHGVVRARSSRPPTT